MSNRYISPQIMGGVATGQFSVVRLKAVGATSLRRRRSLAALGVGVGFSFLVWIGVVAMVSDLI